MTSRKILLCIIVIMLNLELAGAATLNVGKDRTYTTIQSAVNAASTGDIIYVDEGIYYENPAVKTSGISIIGRNREKTIIDGRKTGSVLKIDRANSVKISGFTIRNSGGSGKADAGITLYSADSNLISNSILVDNVAGISIYSGSSNNTVSGNDIKSSSKYGILIFSSTDNRIYNNNIQNNKFGIYADSARKNHIYSNNFIDNTNQAYDNSGLNSWDNGRAGNYWSDFKGRGVYTVSGAEGAVDNYPLAEAVSIKHEAVPGYTEQKPAEEKKGKSTPGLSGLVILILFVMAGVLINRNMW